MNRTSGRHRSHAASAAVVLLALACVLAGQSGTAPHSTATLIAVLQKGDIYAQAQAAQELEQRGLLKQSGVPAALLAALQAGVGHRWTKSGQTDGYSDALAQIMVAAGQAAGMDNHALVRAVLASNDYYPQSRFGYQIADQGARVLNDVIAATHDAHESNRAAAIGVLANMVAEQHAGRLEAPLSAEQVRKLEEAVSAAARASDLSEGYAALWGLSRIGDPQTEPVLEGIIGAHPNARPFTYGDMAVRSLFVVRFCRDKPPENAAELAAFLRKFGSSDWTARARAFCSLLSGVGDPYYGPQTLRLLKQFPSRAQAISTALTGLLTREDMAIGTRADLRADPLYEDFFEKVLMSASVLKGSAVQDALIGALGYHRLAPLYVSRSGPSAAYKLIPLLGRSGHPRIKAAVLEALSAMPFYMKNHDQTDPAAKAAIEQALLAELQDPAPNTRLTAVNGLRGLRDPNTRGMLLRVERTDPDPAVRAKAAEALSEIRPFPPPKL